MGAGNQCRIERFLFPEFVNSPVILTCERTVHDIPVAEHILVLMLGLSRQMHVSIRNQLKSHWDRPCGAELFGKTLGIIGFGSIGKYLATLVRPMGMKIIGWKRTVVRNPYPADEIWTGRKLEKLFSIADYIVIILPKTPETTHLINRKLLSRMKTSAFIINIGRGNALDENALVEVLRRKKIAGAGLDVFETEPLPKSSPLWKLPNVIITPHVGGYSPESDQRRTNLFCNNLKRYLQHKPLLYIVDKKLGY
jgi:phosphoglycerate dehydrogenase-like enzyme